MGRGEGLKERGAYYPPSPEKGGGLIREGGLVDLIEDSRYK